MPQSLDSFDNSLIGAPKMPPISENKFEIPQNYGGQNREGAPEGDPFGGEKFRGSSELPITAEGLMKAHHLGIQLMRKGGLDRLMASSMGRTLHTAKIVSQHTHAPITYVGDGLHPWHLGAMEGQPVTKDRVDFMNYLTKEAPDLAFPGRGPLSVADGESFNAFKQRTLDFLKQVIASSRARPEEKTGLVTHYRVQRLLDAWMRAGMPDDGSVDADTMTTHADNEKPGSIRKLTIDPYAGPQMASVDLDSPQHLGGGIYFIRHEATPWNKKQGPGGPTTQPAPGGAMS